MLTKSRHQLFAFMIVLLGLMALALPAEAAQVLNVKGNKVLILLTPDEVSSVKTGDTFYVQDGDKKLGVVRIVKLQKNRAMAGLLKGRAQKGNLLVSTTASKKDPRKASASSGSGGLIIGLLAGYNSTTMEVKQSGASLKLTGSGFAGKLFGDFTLIEKLGVRLEAGLEQMVAEASANRSVEINYFTGDIMLRYNIMNNRNKVFVASGMGMYYPSSTKLQGGVIKEPPMQTVLLIKGGGLFAVGEKYYVPLQGEYVYFPSNKQVTSSILGVKVGIGMRW